MGWKETTTMEIKNEKDNIELEFIKYGRIRFSDIKESFTTRNCWVKLSKEAWKLAHQERIARFKRLEYIK